VSNQSKGRTKHKKQTELEANTRVSKLRNVLVLVLVGLESHARIFNWLQFEVKQSQIYANANYLRHSKENRSPMLSELKLQHWRF